MKFFTATGLAVLYGLSARGVFGMVQPFQIMSVSFLILAPFAIGFLTTFLVARKKHVSPAGAFFMPWLTSLVILGITILLKIEGLICWIMIYPLFSLAAGFGGLLGNWFCTKKGYGKNANFGENVLDDTRSGTLKMYAVLILPFALGFFEGDNSWNRADILLERSVTIEASSKNIWYSILNIDSVEKNEKSVGLSSWIGFPRHLNTTLDTAGVGGERIATYERGLFFKETITHFEEEKMLALKIDVDPHKIPPTVMDEHILIGGKHVDVYEDIYNLSSNETGSVRLSISSRFMINTPFNWYTSIWAEYLMRDLLDGQLELIKLRSEKLNDR